MMNLVETRAEGLGELSEQWNLALLIRHWQARRSVRQMLLWEPHLLRDIGVERDDVRWAAQLPLTMNASLALEAKALRRLRRAGGQAA